MAERRRENCLTHPVCYVLMNIKWFVVIGLVLILFCFLSLFSFRVRLTVSDLISVCGFYWIAVVYLVNSTLECPGRV